MGKKTGKQRYDDTIKYITAKVNANLQQHIEATLRGKVDTDKVGEEISLGGFSYWRFGTEDQHRAVRALLLCQRTYLYRDTWSKMATLGQDTPIDFAKEKGAGPAITKKACRRWSELEVKRAVLSYVPEPAPQVADVADVALRVGRGSATCGKITWETFGRDGEFPVKPICFQVIPWWLFKAGFISIRWLVRYELGMVAENVNDRLGRGALVTAGNENGIARGHLVNFHAVGKEAVCHWAVSLGSGWAVGANNTEAAGAAVTTFRNNGKGTFGEFEIASMRAVLQNKYTFGLDNRQVGVQVRDIDPAAVATYL